MIIFWIFPELKPLFDAIVTGLGADKEKKQYKLDFAPLILDPTFNAGPCFLMEVVALNGYTDPATLISCGFFLHSKQNFNTFYRMAVELSMAFPNWVKPPSQGGLISCFLDEQHPLNEAIKMVFPHCFKGNCWNHIRGCMEEKLRSLGHDEKFGKKIIDKIFNALDEGEEAYLKLLKDNTKDPKDPKNLPFFRETVGHTNRPSLPGKRNFILKRIIHASNWCGMC
jgi:hypothetical protein